MDTEAPLRAVLSRKFVAYEGTHITLACRHTIVRSKPSHSLKMRCPECRIMDKDKLVELLAKGCEDRADLLFRAALIEGEAVQRQKIDSGLEYLARAAALRSHAQPK